MTPILATEARKSAIAARQAELLTVKEYADVVREHPESVRRRIREQRQPGALWTGGQWRIDLSALASR
jgi:hypothetical protein